MRSYINKKYPYITSLELYITIKQKKKVLFLSLRNCHLTAVAYNSACAIWNPTEKLPASGFSQAFESKKHKLQTLTEIHLAGGLVELFWRERDVIESRPPSLLHIHSCRLSANPVTAVFCERCRFGGIKGLLDLSEAFLSVCSLQKKVHFKNDFYDPWNVEQAMRKELIWSYNLQEQLANLSVVVPTQWPRKTNAALVNE